MKRIFVLLSLCAVFYVTLTAQITPVAPPGAGSESNPYRIESIDNLYWISQNQSQWSKNYIQTVDIDASDTVGLNGGAGWTPIGYYTTRVSVPFTGVYDGQGHTIENLYINAPGTNRSVGLFGYTLGASIERLGLTTYNITGNNRVGSLVGFNLSSIIQDCFSNGEIAGYSDVGGLVGWNDNSTISNSYSISNVTRTSGTEPFFGIFVGYNYNSTIQYSYTGGNVFYTGFVDPTNKGFVGDEESPTRQPRSTNTYQSNFFDNQSSNQETAIGAAAYDTAAMQTRDLYLGEGWDFVYTWALDGVLNGGYPYKLWQEVDAVHPSGSGTEVRPYVINTLSHLFWIAQNPKEWDKHYIQKMNIDATATVNWFGGYGWVPIGSTETNFTGSYNGMGYRIVNLSLNRPETDNVGLFGVTEDSRIKNIGIISPVISGKDQTGTIVGNNSRTDLNNCYIEGGTVNGVQRTGGLIGKNYRSEISYCFTSAIVNGQHFTGGLIGLNDESNIVNSYNSGDVTAAGNDIGGLVGRNYESYLHESYNSGHLNASGSGNRVGGLIGSNYLSLIVNCYNVGNVTLGITDVGGLIGRNYQSTINKSYSKGLVTGSGTGVGGLVGYQIGSSVVESYWDTQTSVQTESAGGEGRITEDMTCPYNFTNTYLNWDFDEIWYLCQTTNEGYPYFRWQSSPRNLVAVEGYGEVTLYWQEPVTMTRQSFSEFSESSDHFFSRTSFLGYNIYRDGSLLEELFPDLVYTDSDVGNDIAYQYYVTAVYEDDVESAPSNVVEATPFSLNVPGNLRATVGDHLVFLEWDEPLPQSVDLIFYRLYRDDTVLAITVDQHYYDNDVVNNQTYQYKVSAVYIVNGVETESEPSNIVEATPYIPPPAYAQSPLPEDGVEMVMVDTQFGWTYTTDPFFSDPIGYKVRAGTDPDLTSYQEVYVAGGPGTYLIDAFLGMDHDETYYWQVIPTTDPETRQSTTRNTGRSGQRDSRSRADAEDCPVWSFTTIAQYTMTISIEGSGTTNPAAGAYQYLDGTMVDIEAFPDPGWDFVKWVIDGVDFTNTLETVTIEGDVEAVAHFIELFSLTVNDPVGLGSVKIDDVDVVTPYVDILEDGTNVTLLAEPDPDWAFVKWVINGVEIFEAETDVTMTEDVTATPHFIELFTLTINDPVGEGAVKVDDVEVVTPYVDILEDGTIVTLLAEPDPDWAFVKWVVNGVEIFDAETDVAMTENVTATPHFIELFTLTINDPVGDGAVKVDDVEVVTPYVDILEDGTIVTLLAEPDPDWAFVKWVVNGVEIFDAETDVTMTENVTATPHFIELFTLTVNDPVGDGAVKVDGVDVVTPYVDILEDGTVVTLFAEPDPDWAFVKWIINGVEIFDAETDVTMTENVTAAPHFILLPKPAAFIYPPDNGSDIPINFTFEWEPVTSGANPDGYLFSYWLAGEAQPEMNDLGNNTVFVVENLDYDTAYHWQVIPYIQGENGERKLLMEPGVKNIIRESDYYYPEEDCPIWSFTTIAEFSLIITIQGSGITSPVEGEHIYLAGTSVNIEAFPYPGWEFEKWIINDALEIYDISTDILMDGNKAITARFQQDPPVTSAPVWGDGSELDPYHVENLNHLYWIAEDSDRWLYHYIQVADIDASATKHWFEGEGWLPIGNPVTPFTGTFDGQNYSIEWLVIDRPSSDHIGLFGYADNSTITNVGLFNSEITGKDYVGSLVGSLVNDSSVSNCFSTGIVTGNDFVGGLLGENNLSVIDNSYSRCEVTGNQYVGGLIGNNHQGSVIHCYSIGFVQGIDQAGGLVGVKTIGGLYTDTNNYWNTETSEIDLSAMGEGRTTNEMTHPHSANTYLDWDFVNLWISEADANNGYPYLFWQDIEGTVVPGGDITELYWTLDNSPYYITEQIMVNADAILYIEEGVEVVFYPGTSLTVWGGLEAQGVLFNSAGTHGSWNGLRFTGNSYGIMIDNCTIINAIPAIVAEDAEGFVTNSLISKNENVFSNQDIAVLIHNYCDIDFSGLQIENYHVGIRYLVDDEEPSRLTTSFSELVIKNRISPLHSDEPVGIHLIEAPVTLLDNIIIYIIGHLSSRVSGNAVVLNGVDDLTIINNTVWGYETGLYARNSSGIMYSNNIIWVENGEIDGLLNPIDIDFENNITVSNCLISYFAGRQNNDTYPGSNNLNVDPKFVDPWNGDFHLRYRSPIKGINIGALGFVFEHLANSYHSFPLRNGWNLIGIPALIYGDNTPATPHEIFSDYLDPFFVHPYYTSIVQMNQIPDATINDQGNYALNFDGAYHAPSNIFPMMGYWVRNYGDPTTVEVYGLIDTDDYLISLPGQGNTSNGWYLLANPYDKPISWGNGIDWENDGEASFVYVHRYNPVYNGYQYLPIEGDAQIAPWEGFFVKSNQPDSEIRFSYPDSFDRDNSAMINNSVTRNSMKRRSHDNSDTSDNNTEWLITLSANHQSNTDVTVVSARANASEDLDGYDVPKLPRAPFVMTNSLIFGIDNRDWNDAPGLYTRDTRSLANDNWSWDILLDVSGLKQGVEIDDYLVTIVLDEMINVPDGYQFSLTNQLTGEIVDPTRDEMIIDLYELLVPQLTSSTRGSERSRDNQDLHIYLQLNISSTNLESEENLSTPVPVIALTNYPNPFNPETRIRYSIGKDTFVKVEVFNIKGQLVKTLVNEFTAAGNHSVTWNGTDDNNNRTSSGIYLYRMTAGKEMITSKMLMIK